MKEVVGCVQGSRWCKKEKSSDMRLFMTDLGLLGYWTVKPGPGHYKI